MTRLLVLDSRGNPVEAARWKGGREESFLLLPRTEYEVFLLDVPPVRGNRLEEALPWRIRAFYPGPMDSTLLDHRPVTGNPTQRLVFAADKEAISKLRSAAPGALLAPAALLSPCGTRTGPWRFVAWTATGIELLRFEGPAFVSSRNIGTEAAGATPPGSALRTALGEEADIPLTVSLPLDPEGGRSAAQAVLAGLTGSFSILSLEDFAERPSAESSSVFAAAGPARILKVLAPASLALALILASLAPGRAANLQQTQLEAVKAEYESAKARSSRVTELATELDRLSARWRELESESRPAAYRILANLAACAGPQVRISSLVLDGTKLRLEAGSPDALSLLVRMRDSGYFSDVELRQSIVLPSGEERSVLSGKARP